MLFYWYTSVAFLQLQAIILPTNSPWTQKSTVSSNISNIETGRRCPSRWSSGLSRVSYWWIMVPFPPVQQFPAPWLCLPLCCLVVAVGLFRQGRHMLSSGISHSGPRDLHNGVTAYSSITIFEYANLLMLVTVIPLPCLMPSWGSGWALCCQQRFSCWFLILSCGWRGNPLDQLPEIEGERKAKREGCEIEKKGISSFYKTLNAFPPVICLAGAHINAAGERWGGSDCFIPPTAAGCVLAVTVPYFCLPWLLPTWILASKWNSWDTNQHFWRKLSVHCSWWSTCSGGAGSA